ncbi:MAG: hypothetical protein GXZ04_03575 [Clostridiales bacterium]|nr:hypothetical protein [Clostridiales bacterium]
MQKDQRFPRATRIISLFLFLSLLFSVVYCVIRLANAPAETTSEGVKVKSDYLLMLIQCVLGLVVWALPSMLKKRFSVRLPNLFLILYFVFLYCAIYLGEVRNYYYTVPHWDTILHGFSGVMLGTLGFSVVLLFHDYRSKSVHLSPAFIALFSFCFAVTLGVVWEVYEFTFDAVLGLNMQKFMLADKTQLVGRAALADTMKDLIVDMAGAGVMSLVGLLIMNKKPEWLLNFDVRPDTAS